MDTTPQKHARSESSFVQLDLTSTIQAERQAYKGHRKAHSSAVGPGSAPEASRGTKNVLSGLAESSMRPPPLLTKSTRPLSRQTSGSSSSTDSADVVMLKKELEAAKAEVASLKANKLDTGSKEYKELERQFSAQEALLSGYQRENERCTEELISLRKWKKTAETHLQRLYGDDFASELNAPSSATRRLGSPGLPRRSMTSPRLASLVETPSPLKQAQDIGPATPSPLPPGLDAMTLLNQLEAVKMLVQEQERRLMQRAAELEVREAETVVR